MKHVALIRGINVGRAKRVAMADLRAFVAGLGYHDVQTLLNSGNVVFSTDDDAQTAAAQIEKAMESELGVAARAIVLSGAAVSRIMSENTLLDLADNPSRLFVAVLADPDDTARLKPIQKQDWAPEALAVGSRAAYIWCPNGIAKSLLSEAVGKVLRDGVTTRNWATMTKLQALLT